MFIILFNMLIFLSIITISMMLLENNYNEMKIYSKLEVECGMFSFLNKNCFSSLYLLFMIVFLIFDLEIILILILIFNEMLCMDMLFYCMILLSLKMEIYDNSLKWND